MMKSILTLLTCLVVAATASARDLDVAAAKVKKEEIRYGMMGPRETVIFYTFADQAAVLQLNISQAGGKFTLSGKMLLFKEGTNGEGLGNWINNQHSDALFPDVPEPEATVALPAEACTVLESKPKEGAAMSESPLDGSKFQDYALKLQISDLKMEGFRLKGFTLDASAFVKVG